MQTTVTELPDSKVKIEVAVDADRFSKRVDRAARDLAGEMKMPGFRKGKVPPQMVIQRIGREAVVEQAMRDALPEWYEQALLASGVSPIGDPKLDVGDLPGQGEDLEFTIEVGVRPKAELGDYKGLEVGRAEVDVPEEAIGEELERLRGAFGSLSPVDRPAAEGDAVVIDFEGLIDGEPFEGSSSKDFTIELGAEGLLPEFDAALTGAATGDERTVEVTFPEDHRPEELAAKTASFAVTVKEVREKNLPELDDDFASEASEFDTLDELRESIRSRLAEALDRRAEADFRQAAVDAVAANAKLEIPHELVHARAHEMWERIERQLAASGIDPQAYAQMQGKDRHDLINDAEADAEQGLRRRRRSQRSPRPRGSSRATRTCSRRWARGRKERPGEAAGAAARDRPRQPAARRGAPADGGRRRRRVGHPDPGRAGGRARPDLDAGQGGAGESTAAPGPEEPEPGKLWTPGR